MSICTDHRGRDGDTGPRPPCVPRALRHPAMADVATTPPSINGRRRRNTSTWRVQDGYFGNPRSNPRLPPPSCRLPDFVIAELRPKSAYLFVRPGSVSSLFVEVLPGSRFAHRRQSKRLNDPPREQAHVPSRKPVTSHCRRIVRPVPRLVPEPSNLRRTCRVRYRWPPGPRPCRRRPRPTGQPGSRRRGMRSGSRQRSRGHHAAPTRPEQSRCRGMDARVFHSPIRAQLRYRRGASSRTRAARRRDRGPRPWARVRG